MRLKFDKNATLKVLLHVNSQTNYNIQIKYSIERLLSVMVWIK